MQLKSCDALRERWEERAQADPMFYIAAERKDWSQEEFFASGEEEIARLVDPFLARRQLCPDGRVAVDIGCGMGRLTQALARRFAVAHGFDISARMVDLAIQSLPGDLRDRAAFHVTDGRSLAPLADGTADFGFSFIVLQHVPTAAIVLGYLRELHRVLKPGGMALLQVNGIRRQFTERLRCGIVPSARVPLLHRKLKLKLDPHSTMGVTFSEAGIRTLARKARLDVLAVTGGGTQYMWVELSKA